MEGDFFKRLWTRLTDKRQLSMRDRTSDEPHWKVNLTPIGVVSGITAFVVIIFAIVMLLVAYTPILEIFPGYKRQSEAMHDRLVESIMRIDSMERTMGRMLEYNSAVTEILNGGTPTLRSTIKTDSTQLEKTSVLPSRADSLLRNILEREEGVYSLSNSKQVTPVAAMFSAPHLWHNSTWVRCSRLELRHHNYGYRLGAHGDGHREWHRGRRNTRICGQYVDNHSARQRLRINLQAARRGPCAQG